MFFRLDVWGCGGWRGDLGLDDDRVWGGSGVDWCWDRVDWI